MIIQEARERLRESALKADKTTYPDTTIDRAIQTVLDDFFMEVSPEAVTGTVALTATSNVYDLTSLTRFEPWRANRFEVREVGMSTDHPGHQLEHVSYDTVADDIVANGTALGTGKPELIGFRSRTEAVLDVTPGTSYPDMRVVYDDSLVQWFPGDSSAGTVTINIPNEFLGIAIWDGAAAHCQHNDPRVAFQSEGWLRYVDFRNRVAGRAGLGATPSLHLDDTSRLTE